jgi:hypothetical protein
LRVYICISVVASSIRLLQYHLENGRVCIIHEYKVNGQTSLQRVCQTNPTSTGTTSALIISRAYMIVRWGNTIIGLVLTVDAIYVLLALLIKVSRPTGMYDCVHESPCTKA